jgi:hypothetical protein
MANITPETVEVSGQLCAQASLPLGKEPVVPFERRLGGPRGSLNGLEKRKPKSYIKKNLSPLPGMKP